MRTKKLVFVAVSLVMVFLCSWWWSRHLIWIDGRWLSVERAETVAEREQGLSERAYLCARCGMLFDFEKPGQYAFWMKGMEFPLDIVWIADTRVVFIQKNIPTDNSEVFNPPVLADQVLEMNAGKTDEWGIQVGDSVH